MIVGGKGSPPGLESLSCSGQPLAGLENTSEHEGYLEQGGRPLGRLGAAESDGFGSHSR